MTGAPEFLRSKEIEFFGIKISEKYQLESVDSKMKELGIDRNEWRIPNKIELIKINKFPPSLFIEDVPTEHVITEDILNQYINEPLGYYLIFCKQFNF